MRGRKPIHGIKAFVWLGVSATSVALVISAASAAAPAMKPAAGTIHVYLVDTSLNPNARNNILITGAFSDHGTGKNGIWVLTEGIIKVNNSAVAAIAKSPNWGTSYAASCSFDGVARGPVIIVSGTGAYAGITGSLAFTLTEAGEGSLLKNGECNQSNNAPAVAEDLIGTGSGKVSFK
ncbi:MAG: hypothetical protein ABSE77_04625 [Acidimicrobiales bacterium]|jgi:hypothetical protein